MITWPKKLRTSRNGYLCGTMMLYFDLITFDFLIFRIVKNQSAVNHFMQWKANQSAHHALASKLMIRLNSAQIRVQESRNKSPTNEDYTIYAANVYALCPWILFLALKHSLRHKPCTDVYMSLKKLTPFLTKKNTNNEKTFLFYWKESFFDFRW